MVPLMGAGQLCIQQFTSEKETMDNIWKMGLIIAFTIFLSLSLAGCVSPPSTKYGQSYIYGIPSILEKLGLSTGESAAEQELSWLEKEAQYLFEELYAENPELAKELGRIPEFTGHEISAENVKGLKTLTDFYVGYSDNTIIKGTNDLLKLGEGHGKYNTPVRLLLWYAMKHELDGKDMTKIVGHGPLVFLDQMWRNEGLELDTKQLHDMLNDPILAKWWVDNYTAYESDVPGSGKFKRPGKTLIDGKGDCEDLAGLMADFLHYNNWPVRLVASWWLGEGPKKYLYKGLYAG
ncbi:unnamed protein product, partial [marine sediment metagenome]